MTIDTIGRFTYPKNNEKVECDQEIVLSGWVTGRGLILIQLNDGPELEVERSEDGTEFRCRTRCPDIGYHTLKLLLAESSGGRTCLDLAKFTIIPGLAEVNLLHTGTQQGQTPLRSRGDNTNLASPIATVLGDIESRPVVYYYKTDASALIGNVDSVSENGIIGWVHDTADPHRRVEVLVYLDGLLHGVSIANFYRHDLLLAGIGDGFHAFYMSFSSFLRRGQEVQIVLCTASGEMLTSEPVTVVMASQTLQSAIQIVENAPIKGFARSLFDNNRFAVFTAATAPFSDAFYLIDKSSGLVMTWHRQFPSKPDVDIRGLSGTWSGTGRVNWLAEFFCESEGFIGLSDGENTVSLPLNDMVFSGDWYSEEGNCIAVWTRSDHAQPAVLENLNSSQRALLAPFSRIEIANALLAGQRYVQTEVKLHLKVDKRLENLRCCYAYQDAAYLWFPRANQVGIVPFSLIVSDSGVTVRRLRYGYATIRVQANHHVYVGYYDPDNGVFSLLQAVESDTLIGVRSAYLEMAAMIDLDGLPNDMAGDISHEPSFGDKDSKVLFCARLSSGSLAPHSAIYRRYGYHHKAPFKSQEAFEAQLVEFIQAGYQSV